MYNLTLEDIIFLMFYASVAILSLMASCYLLFRRANAIAPDVMSPLYNRGTGTLLHERIAIVNDGDSLFSPTSSLFFKYLWPSGDKVVSLHHQLLIFHLILWLVNQEK